MSQLSTVNPRDFLWAIFCFSQAFIRTTWKDFFARGFAAFDFQGLLFNFETSWCAREETSRLISSYLYDSVKGYSSKCQFLNESFYTDYHRMSGIPEFGKFLLVKSRIQQIFAVESRILGFGIWNTAQGIWNLTVDWNPESKFLWQRIRNPRRGIHILDCLGFPYKERIKISPRHRSW